jgi:hypothetical protein
LHDDGAKEGKWNKSVDPKKRRLREKKEEE